jgi:lipopolysaccharide transport system permease protein
VTFGVQLLMYGTTVIYPLSAAPEKYKTIIELNPMTGIIEAFRYCFLGKRRIHAGQLGLFDHLHTCSDVARHHHIQ